MARKKKDPNDLGARRSQWLKGVLDLCVLGLIGDESRYGYDLATQFEAIGLGAIKGGTLYPRLTAMEDDGLLESEWRPGDGGPGRKYYRVSPAGSALLANGAGEWTRFANTVSLLLAEPPIQQPPPPGAASVPAQPSVAEANDPTSARSTR